MGGEMFGEAYRKFVTEIPDIKPNVMFTALWVEDDDLDYVRTLLYACARRLRQYSRARTRTSSDKAGLPAFTPRPPA